MHCLRREALGPGTLSPGTLSPPSPGFCNSGRQLSLSRLKTHLCKQRLSKGLWGPSILAMRTHLVSCLVRSWPPDLSSHRHYSHTAPPPDLSVFPRALQPHRSTSRSDCLHTGITATPLHLPIWPSSHGHYSHTALPADLSVFTRHYSHITPPPNLTIFPWDYSHTPPPPDLTVFPQVLQPHCSTSWSDCLHAGITHSQKNNHIFSQKDWNK